MTIQDQYIDTFRQTQDTWTDVAKSFTNDVQRAFGQASAPFSYVDPNKAIDQVFDFWEKSAKEQREVAKQLRRRDHLGRREDSAACGVGERRGARERGLGWPGHARAGGLGHRDVQLRRATLRAQAAKTYTI